LDSFAPFHRTDELSNQSSWHGNFVVEVSQHNLKEGIHEILPICRFDRPVKTFSSILDLRWSRLPDSSRSWRLAAALILRRPATTTSDMFYFVGVRSGQSYFNSYVPTVSERKRTKRRQRLEVMVSSLRTTEGSAGWFKLSQCQVFYPMMVFWCLGHKGCGLLDR
jgi:hypothetical protein